MEIIEKKVTLRKLTASEGKLLVPKTKDYDEEGNEIERIGSKEVYLASNASPEEWEEIDEIKVVDE